MTNYVNGVPVDQLKIIPEGDGYRIEYIEKFNILKATNREIIDKLMADELKCIPVIYEKYKIIVLHLNSIDDVWKIVDCLNLHNTSHEIDWEQELITVDM